MQRLVYLVLGFHLVLLTLLQFTAWPEMISFPYLLNNGFVTYKEMIHAYPPLLINMLAVVFDLFGYNINVLKFFTWSFLLINDVLIFFLIKKLTDNKKLAVVSVLSYAILQPILEGNMIWPDVIITTFILGGIYFLFNKNFWFAGFFFALGLLTKQTGVFYLGIALIYLIINEREVKKTAYFLSGFILPTGVFLINLFSKNSLSDFLKWTLIYPSQYWTKFPGYLELSPSFKDSIILFVFLGVLIFSLNKNKKLFFERQPLFLLGFLFVSFLSFYPRFSFFHLQSFLAIFILVIFYSYRNIKDRRLLLILIFPFLVFCLNFKSLDFGGNRFWDSGINLGEKIELQTTNDKTVYFLGLNSDLYSFSKRVPNKPWLDNFGWYLEIPGIQEEVVKSFENSPPQKIFWRTPDDGNWYDIGSYQPTMVVDYIRKNYTKFYELENGVEVWERN